MKIPSRRYTGPNAGGWVHPQSPRRQVNHYHLRYVPGAGWAFTLGGAAIRLNEHCARYHPTRQHAVGAAALLGLPVAPDGSVEARLLDVS